MSIKGKTNPKRKPSKYTRVSSWLIILFFAENTDLGLNEWMQGRIKRRPAPQKIDLLVSRNHYLHLLFSMWRLPYGQ